MKKNQIISDFADYLERTRLAVEIGEAVLNELNSGGGNYLKGRMQIAELSGLPAMSVTWDQHIEHIKKKLEGYKNDTRD
jgi:hypothetical protein